jgi:hypothetical protein
MCIRVIGRAVAIVVVLACVVPAAQAQTAQAQSPIAMLTGDQRTLAPGYAIGNIAIGDPKVCDFKMLPGRREVMLVAKGQGHTLLTLWDQQGAKRAEIEIDVTSREVAKLKADLVEVLRPYPGVQVGSLGNRLALTGTVDTLAELQAVKAIAQAAGGVQSLVTSREADTSRSARPAAAAPASPPARTPTPRPISPGTATPVPLGAGSGGGSTTPTTPGSTMPRSEPLPAPAAAVPVTGAVGQAPSTAPAPLAGAPGPAAVPNPPPPNVAPAGVPMPTPVAPTTGRQPSARPTAAGANTARVEYEIELIETSASAPPPEVMGPQGRSLFRTRVSATPGTEVRQFIAAEGAPSPAGAGALTGISIGIRPTVDGGGRVRTSLVVDTNLPIGRVTATKAPATWSRAQLDFSVSAGETRYVTERELGALFKPYSVAADPASGTQTGGRAGGGARVTPPLTGEEARIARTLGGLFGKRDVTASSKAQQTPANQPVLLIVITPYLATAP